MLNEKYSECGNFSIFSMAQILHEINFEDSRSAKTAIFAIFGATNVVNLVNISLQKVQKVMKNQNSESLNVQCVEIADFALLQSSKIDFI